MTSTKVEEALGAEECVLGAMMLDRSVVWPVAEVVSADDFLTEEHQQMFAAILWADTNKQTTDIVVVAEAMEQNGSLAKAGGLAALGRLARNVPATQNAVHYANMVKARSTERKLRKVGHELMLMSEDRSEDVVTKIDNAQQLVLGLSVLTRDSGPTLVGKGISDWMNALDERQQRGGGLAGIPTGLADIDRMTAGLEPGDLIIVAGRPSMGKTSLAMNIAQYTAQRRKCATAFFSMEMRTKELLSRCVSSDSGIPLHTLRNADLTGEDWRKISESASNIQDVPLFVDDTPALTLAELKSRARRVKQKYGLHLIVVDYIQLMTGDGENRTNEVSAISRGLKALAKELEVPIIALSQLNRDLERRVNKRPMMSDLRESGSIEQDADLIFFVYREVVYNNQTNWADAAELIVAKQRNGPIGTVVSLYHAPTCTFRNADHGYQQSYNSAMNALRSSASAGFAA